MPSVCWTLSWRASAPTLRIICALARWWQATLWDGSYQHGDEGASDAVRREDRPPGRFQDEVQRISGPASADRGEKKLYGRTVVGVIRSTVLIDPAGKVAHHWRTVRAKGHADKVRQKLEEMG